MPGHGKGRRTTRESGLQELREGEKWLRGARIHEVVDAPNWVVGAFLPDDIFTRGGNR
jgi:hypothetical protein